MTDGRSKKEGKQLGIAQNCFPGCVLDVFAYIDAARKKRLHNRMEEAKQTLLQ